MNKDRISTTPGGERMLIGGIAFGLAFLGFHGLRYQLGDVGTLAIFAVMTYGAIQFGRGVFDWKYADRKKFAAQLNEEHLFVDVPLKDLEISTLHRIEDALFELIRSSKTIEINLHSVDKANNIGTIHLSGKQADAMYVQIYATLARFALPNGIHLFPKSGRPIDTEIHGKRVLLDMPKTEVQL
ncbi:MAG: hypothetical protein AAF412_06405 [Pseudomonadota bacterium]